MSLIVLTLNLLGEKQAWGVEDSSGEEKRSKLRFCESCNKWFTVFCGKKESKYMCIYLLFLFQQIFLQVKHFAFI